MEGSQIQAQITQLNADLTAAQAESASMAQSLATANAALAAWMADYRGPGRSADADNAIAVYNAQIVNYTQRKKDADERVKNILAALDAARKDQAAYNKALADAASKGLFGEAAETAAQQSLDRAALFNRIILGAAILLGIAAAAYGFVLFKRWKRNK